MTVKTTEGQVLKVRVENKYNILPSDIEKLKVKDRSKIGKPLFWRNEAIEAWCVMEEVGEHGFEFGNNYWLGIYDDNSIKYDCSCYGAMMNYNFKSFYDQSEIDCKDDLLLQEMLLRKINYLIDNGILEIEKRKVES